MNVVFRWAAVPLFCVALQAGAQEPAGTIGAAPVAPEAPAGKAPVDAPALDAAKAEQPAPTPASTAPTAPAKADVDARLDRLYGAHQPYADFLVALKQASAANDRQAIARMVHYPFSTHLAARRRTLATPKAFLARYTDIMTPKVRAAIAAQTYETLFSNSNGLMIGSGEVWFTGKCVDATCSKPAIIGISAINANPGSGHDAAHR
jgi:hypothetical protein